MSDPSEKPAGILASLRRILDGGLAILENRIELFAVEIREEKCRLIEAMLWASAAVVLGLMTLTLLTFVIVISFGESARMAVLLTLSGLYLLGTIVAWRGLRARLRRTTAFSGTLDEIKKDRACLETEN
ncbi:MAG TPA: phage holin family protein [Verrucomicrobiae bacterium]|jgi:uncharacterized membrane protein YqjE